MSNARNLADLIASGGVIEASEIADSTITGGKLASDITISTTGTITTSQVNLGDSEYIYVGASNDLQIYHNGSHSYISDQGAGNLFIQGTNIELRDSAGYRFINCIDDGNGGTVELYDNASKKFETTSTGATITGTLVADGLTVDTDTLYVDSTNNRVGIGTTSPLHPLQVQGVIYPTTYLQLNSGQQVKFGNGNQYIEGTNDTSLELATGGSTSMIINDSGQVGIGTTTPSYKLEVTGDAYVSTDLTVGGNLTVSGTTTTIDTTNTQVTDNLLELNSGATANTNDAGIIIERGTTGDNAIMAWDESADQFIFGTTTATASDTGNLTISTANMTVNNIDLTGNVYVSDGRRVFWGNGNQASIEYFGGLNLRNSTNVVIELTGSTNKTFQIKKFGGEQIFKASGDGAVELYYDGTKTLETTSTGATVTGTLVADGVSLGDSEYISVGASNDLEIYHNSDDTFVDNNTRHLYITTNANGDTGGAIFLKPRSAHVGVSVYQNAGVWLHYAGSKKFETTSTGIDVTGTLVADGLTVDTDTLYVDSTNNRVGIGTTSPATQLHISSGTSGDAILRIEADTDNNAESDQPRIEFAQDGGIQVTAIGHLSSNNYLTIANSITTGGIAFATGTSNGFTNATERMFIDDSGLVGIGTTSPQVSLHLEFQTPIIRLQDSDGTDQYATIKQDGANLKIMSRNNTGSSGVLIRRDVGGTETDAFQLQSNGDISFYNNAGSSQDLFWDASESRLGIGTTSPIRNLEIVATNSGAEITAFQIRNNATAAGTASALRFTNSTSNTSNAGSSKIVGYRPGVTNDGELHFYTADNSATMNNRMVIDSSGRVGIGDTSPDALLSIKGNSDAGTIPTIRLKDGTDTREAFVSNSAGDLILATASSSDNVIDSAITIYSSQIVFNTGGITRLILDSSGHWIPDSTNTYDLGSSSKVWRNIYTSDFHMSNEGLDKGNDIDGTKGSWTFQEGENDLFLINNKNGKKYKFNLTEVA